MIITLCFISHMTLDLSPIGEGGAIKHLGTIWNQLGVYRKEFARGLENGRVFSPISFQMGIFRGT